MTKNTLIYSLKLFFLRGNYEAEKYCTMLYVVSRLDNVLCVHGWWIVDCMVRVNFQGFVHKIKQISNNLNWCCIQASGFNGF